MSINIGIGKDRKGWYKKFEESFRSLNTAELEISIRIIDLDSNDFLKEIDDLQVILWNPSYMGLRLAGHYKEKIYFLEKILGKILFPNYETIWHFESKVAENMIFNHGKVKTPKTYITFDYLDALDIIKQIKMPIVLKKSEGAASKNVKLIQNKKWLFNYAQRVFCNQLWAESRYDKTKSDLLIKYFTKKWFWYFIFSHYYYSDSGMGVLYLQEYLPNNDADLRITIIGNKYAYGFWRNNRPGDFRASGSGLIDYDREVPEEALRYCQNVNTKYGFDTMAYDILYKDDIFYINEMSYNYDDHALYNASGYYVLGKEINFIQEQTWPQFLWVKALYEKLNSK